MCQFSVPRGSSSSLYLYLENIVSEKLVVMVLLEGLRYSKTGVAATHYFGEMEHLLNNGILTEEN